MINYGILQQPQAPGISTQVMQMPQQPSAADQLGSAVSGLLGKTFGQNPVSQANQAVSQSISQSPLQSIAQAILPQGMSNSPQPQSPSNGLLNGFKQALQGDQKVSLQDNPGYSDFQGYQKQLQQRQQQQTQQPGDVHAASMSAYSGKSPYEVAQSFLGDGRQNHAEVIESFMKKAGQGNVNIQTTPWCAGFANAVLKATGHGSSGSLAARSMLNYGTPTKNPSQGDIVVFSDLTRANNPAHGHTGFYAGPGDKPGYIKVLGGNQSGSVSIHEYPASKVLGYRIPPTAQELQQSQQQAQQNQPY